MVESSVLFLMILTMYGRLFQNGKIRKWMILK